MTNSKQRLDLRLVELKLAPTRAKAQELIKSGCVNIVSANGSRLAKKAGELVAEGESLELTDAKLLKYVSRAGLKLESALEDVGFSVNGLKALDFGLSTGGFADCLLQQGASSVVGFDVGTEQLAESLRQHPQLTWVDNLDARDAKKHPTVLRNAPFDLLTVDVSFISLDKIMSEVLGLLKLHGHVLALVKPQYEMDGKNLNDFSETEIRQFVESKISSHFQEMGLKVLRFFTSRLKGKDETQEYFLFAQKI